MSLLVNGYTKEIVRVPPPAVDGDKVEDVSSGGCYVVVVPNGT